MWSRVVALALVASACGSGEDAGRPATGDARGAPAARPDARSAAGIDEPTPTPRPVGDVPPTTPAIHYPESIEGLTRLASDLVAAARGKDEAGVALLLESLRLRDADAWFEVSFGKTLGRELAQEYRPLRDEIGQLLLVLERLAADGQTALAVERFERAEEPSSVGYQSAALAKMARRVPLYSLRFRSANGKQVFHLWSFVHQDGSFRYVGKMKRTVDAAPPPGRDALELRLADAARMRAPGR